MTNLNNNLITVRFSFLNKGSKLKANYKPLTGNFTISSTIISHSKLNVQSGLIDCVINENFVFGGRATLCFNDRAVATQVINLINNELRTKEEVCVQVSESDLIRYNSDLMKDTKSLTIFNPLVSIVPNAVVEVEKFVKTAPVDETVPFNYEEVLKQRDSLKAETSSHPTVSAAREGMSLVSTKERIALIKAGFSSDEIKELSREDIKELVECIEKQTVYAHS